MAASRKELKASVGGVRSGVLLTGNGHLHSAAIREKVPVHGTL
ncbi:MAG: hypothetical protein AB1374_12505 [Bacillota bacterium]